MRWGSHRSSRALLPQSEHLRPSTREPKHCKSTIVVGSVVSFVSVLISLKYDNFLLDAERLHVEAVEEDDDDEACCGVAGGIGMLDELNAFVERCCNFSNLREFMVEILARMLALDLVLFSVLLLGICNEI